LANKFLHGFALIRRTEPWPHLFFQRAFKPEVYTEIQDNLPSLKRFTTLDTYKEYRRVWALSSAEAGTFWHDVNTVFTSNMFRDEISTLLKVDKPLYPKPALIYDLPGYEIGPHRDASFKAATMLIYLPEDSSQKMLGTRLLKKEDGEFTFRKQLGFFPNTGVAFKPDARSWHDVPKTPPSSGIRKTLHICFFDTPEREFK
jgi:hypothetical protein